MLFLFYQETVLNLKEKIVGVAGIPVDQQRLIFRGRVLKDDHLLSEYRILLFVRFLSRLEIVLFLNHLLLHLSY